MEEIEAVKYEQKLKKELKAAGMPIIDGEACDIRLESIKDGKRKAKLKNPNYKEGRPLKYTGDEILSALKLLENMSYKDVEKITNISKSTLIRAKKKLQSIDKQTVQN
jgi:DNA invertase Pin-like site-specific DNA recombinase